MADVVDLIMEDHREVERLFEQMKTQPDQRPMLVPVVTTLLIAHSRAEESEVYPVARDEAGEAEEVAHSQEEHAEAEEILERLKATDHTAPEFDSVLGELIDAVTHHVEEEESSVLPGMRDQLSEDRRAELGEAFMSSRAEHMGEQPGEATKDELLQQADNVDAAANESMTKDEIEREIRP
ncbi:MAG: hemerythrin domain-containing protein [Acidimicrobiia bacterium]|nr:hemerythrin domain-containing protein [Acidimicrobiia bacterium]